MVVSVCRRDPWPQYLVYVISMIVLWRWRNMIWYVFMTFVCASYLNQLCVRRVKLLVNRPGFWNCIRPKQDVHCMAFTTARLRRQTQGNWILAHSSVGVRSLEWMSLLILGMRMQNAWSSTVFSKTSIVKMFTCTTKCATSIMRLQRICGK